MNFIATLYTGLVSSPKPHESPCTKPKESNVAHSDIDGSQELEFDPAAVGHGQVEAALQVGQVPGGVHAEDLDFVDLDLRVLP